MRTFPLVLVLLAACAGNPGSNPTTRVDQVHECIVRVTAAADDSVVVDFEHSQRRFIIDPAKSPEHKSMIAFAEAARAAARPVYATVAPSGVRTKGDGGPAFVLIRMADTPDPAAK